jgi:hypothetical protein
MNLSIRYLLVAAGVVASTCFGVHIFNFNNNTDVAIKIVVQLISMNNPDHVLVINPNSTERLVIDDWQAHCLNTQTIRLAVPHHQSLIQTPLIVFASGRVSKSIYEKAVRDTRKNGYTNVNINAPARNTPQFICSGATIDIIIDSTGIAQLIMMQ